MLGRRVGAEGRTRAFVQGRSASAADLRELGGRLVAFYGQHEHRRLTLGSAQLEALDAFCGPKHLAARERFAAVHAARGVAGGRARPRCAGGPGHGSATATCWPSSSTRSRRSTRARRTRRRCSPSASRLQRIDGLRAAAGGGAEALAARRGRPRRRAAARRGGATGRRRRGRRPRARRAGGAAARAADRGRRPGRRAARATSSASRPSPAGSRRSRRGSTPTTGSSASTAARSRRCSRTRERCRSELALLDNSEAALAEARGRARVGRGGRARAARRRCRRRAARRRRSSPSGCSPSSSSSRWRAPRSRSSSRSATEFGPPGAERVEFLIAPNPGVPPAPLRETASGGELSRAMLALMTVADAGGARTLVFDEVDAGIGGQTARAVGERLRALADGRQVICITHLPQIASLAERHFRIAKDAAADVARTSSRRSTAAEVVEELCGCWARTRRRRRAPSRRRSSSRRHDRRLPQRAGWKPPAASAPSSSASTLAR